MKNIIVYGVCLNVMRKVLVIRTPYIFYNRTKLTYELRIIKPLQNESEKIRFKLEPEAKFSLDVEYYQLDAEYGIQMRVLGEKITKESY